MTTQDSQTVPRLIFVDFMYAIVVGSAFPLIAPLEMSFRFFGLLFLLLVVLEDFYLYHTQIVAPSQAHGSSFLALVVEMCILLAWYLGAIAFPENPRVFLTAFAAFFALKWLAGLAHFAALRELRTWRFYRCFSFLIPLAGCVVVLFVGGDGRLSSPSISGTVAGAWALQTAIWWSVTKRQERITGIAA